MPQEKSPTLVVFSGLPGTGKTTVSKALAARLGAVYLRIDSIEQAMRAAGVAQVGAAGYGVAQAVAEANLLLGRSVVADCVNPVRESRLAWREVAVQSSTRLVDIYLVCTDAMQHRRRVEGRAVDVPGLAAPTWESVQRHEFEERADAPLRLDTATLTPEELIERCEAAINPDTATSIP